MNIFPDKPDESSAKVRYQEPPLPSLKIGMDAPSDVLADLALAKQEIKCLRLDYVLVYDDLRDARAEADALRAQLAEERAKREYRGNECESLDCENCDGARPTPDATALREAQLCLRWALTYVDDDLIPSEQAMMTRARALVATPPQDAPVAPSWGTICAKCGTEFGRHRLRDLACPDHGIGGHFQARATPLAETTAATLKAHDAAPSTGAEALTERIIAQLPPGVGKRDWIVPDADNLPQEVLDYYARCAQEEYPEPAPDATALREADLRVIRDFADVAQNYSRYAIERKHALAAIDRIRAALLRSEPRGEE